MEVNRVLYWVLVVGMLTSTSLFVIGLAAFAIPSVSGYSWSILTAGAVVLIATPVTRTFAGTVMFSVNGEKRSAMVAGFVFLILMLSVFLGFVLHFKI